MRYLLIPILITFLAFGNFSMAQEEQEFPSDSEVLRIYVFHLYYDNERVVPDRDFEIKYDIVEEEYITASGSLRYEVINKLGEVAFAGSFDPQDGDPSFLKGKINVRAPYVADGDKVNFYDKEDSISATIDVGESSFCNDDNFCDKDRGENAMSCPNDCGSPDISPSPVIGLGSISLIALIAYVIRKIRGRKSSAPPPASMPPSGPIAGK
jgi:hypothetical protein